MKALLIALCTLLLVAIGAASWQHHRAGALVLQLANAQSQAIAAGFEASAAKLNERTVTQFVDRVRVVHDTTQTLLREIPTYVTPTMDHLYPLPVGFVRVHDAAAAGLPGLPAPRAADASGSPVEASRAIAVIVDNYGTCHETAEQLSALQEWVQQRATLEDATP
jgi:hypothetical protein